MHHKCMDKPSLVYCLFPVPMCSNDKGRQEVIIDYLWCVSLPVQGKIVFQMHFAITITVK